jgi:hypothetical protein
MMQLKHSLSHPGREGISMLPKLERVAIGGREGWLSNQDCPASGRGGGRGVGRHVHSGHWSPPIHSPLGGLRPQEKISGHNACSSPD